MYVHSFIQQWIICLKNCALCKGSLTLGMKVSKRIFQNVELFLQGQDNLETIVSAMCYNRLSFKMIMGNMSQISLRYYCIWLMDESTNYVVTFLWADLFIYENVRMLSFPRV